MLFKSLIRASFLGKFTIIHVSRKSSAMSRIFVRCVGAEDRIQISLKYPPEGGATVGGKQRMYNFDRLKSEEVERTLSRISANVSKVVNKRVKKKQAAEEEPAPAEVRVLLYDGENPVSSSEPNENAWTEGRLLKIEDMVYRVNVNLPTVKKISLPEPIMVGFAVRANVELEFADQSNCQFLWYRLTAGRVPPADNSCNGETSSGCTINGAQENSTYSGVDASNDAKMHGKKRKKSTGSVPEWNEIHRGRTYTPSIEDVGCRLRLECYPRDGARDGESACADAKVEVIPGPIGSCPFETRHKLTEKLTDKDCVRFITYNILADTYADSDYSRDFLFPYCPADKLNMDYRRQLILKELLGYNADIICLQEVDRKVFERDLCPVLKEAGLSGLQRLKYGEVAEGSEGTAIFYRDSRFRLISEHNVCLSKVLQEDPQYADMLEKITKSEELKEKVFNRTSALQVALLEATDNSHRQILVCTIHQYFHPRAPHVRAIQTITSIRHIESILSQLKLQGSQPVVVFCGDLNSYPEGGCHTFITQKHISSRHGDWYAGGKVEFIEGMDFSHSLDLVSACGYPRYTNYVTGFASCLDYIYVESHRLETTRVIPLPTHEEVTRLTALPNEQFPSDHLALVCELSWHDQ